MDFSFPLNSFSKPGELLWFKKFPLILICTQVKWVINKSFHMPCSNSHSCINGTCYHFLFLPPNKDSWKNLLFFVIFSIFHFLVDFNISCVPGSLPVKLINFFLIPYFELLLHIKAQYFKKYFIFPENVFKHF